VAVDVFLTSTRGLTPRLCSYDATTSAMIETRKHQSLADPLLQSSVVTIAFSVLERALYR